MSRPTTTETDVAGMCLPRVQLRSLGQHLRKTCSRAVVPPDWSQPTRGSKGRKEGPRGLGFSKLGFSKLKLGLGLGLGLGFSAFSLLAFLGYPLPIPYFSHPVVPFLLLPLLP